MKGVQCYELFGGIALKNHAFSFFICKKFSLNVIVIEPLEIWLSLQVHKF